MKKSLIALAALAAVSAASAQSTVTLSGTYSASYQTDLSATTANPVVISGLTGASSSVPANLTYGKAKGFAITDATLKLAAVEDLGGGLKASFDYLLETGAQRGAPVTRADSGIGISGGFGAVAIRNTRSSDLLASIASPAISLPDGLYDATGILGRSNIDTVSYTSPSINGFTGSITLVETAEGNITAPVNNKSTNVLGVSYANGPLTVSAAFKSKPSSVLVSSGLTAKANSELAVSYDLGVAKISAAIDSASVEGTSSAAIGAFALQANAQAVANLQTKSASGFSVTVPMGALTFGAQYFKRDISKVTEFGVSYAFSKRTALNVATGTKSGLFENLGYKGTQNRVQLKHTF